MIQLNNDLITRIAQENLVVLRDKYTKKALAISHTEDGLRTKANKNGVYFYCEGRITDYKKALKSPRSKNTIVERFVPKIFNNKQLDKIESHYVEEALHKLID